MAQRKITQLEQAVIRTALLLVEEWRTANGGSVAVAAPRYDAFDHARDALWQHLARIGDSPGYAGVNAPDTSVAAASRIFPVSGTIRRHVVNELYLDAQEWNDPQHEGLTCDDIERRVHRPHTSVSSAIYYLRHAGWIFDSGRVRSTTAGRDAIIWRLTPRAWEEMSI